MREAYRERYRGSGGRKPIVLKRDRRDMKEMYARKRQKRSRKKEINTENVTNKGTRLARQRSTELVDKKKTQRA